MAHLLSIPYYITQLLVRGMVNNMLSVPAVFIDGRPAFVGFPFSEEALVASIEEALNRIGPRNRGYSISRSVSSFVGGMRRQRAATIC
jgi:hypothetical protein